MGKRKPDDLDRLIAELDAAHPGFAHQVELAVQRRMAEASDITSDEDDDGPLEIEPLLTAWEACAVLHVPNTRSLLKLARQEGLEIWEPTEGEYLFNASAVNVLAARLARQTGSAA